MKLSTVPPVGRDAHRAAGTQHVSGHAREANLVRRLERRAGPHDGLALDERPGVILEQEHGHAVGQDVPLVIRDGDVPELRELELFPRLLRRGRVTRGRAEREHEGEGEEQGSLKIQVSSHLPLLPLR